MSGLKMQELGSTDSLINCGAALPVWFAYSAHACIYIYIYYRCRFPAVRLHHGTDYTILTHNVTACGAVTAVTQPCALTSHLYF